MLAYALSGAWLKLWSAISPVLKTYSRGQMRFPRTAMTNAVHPQMNQIRMLIANFSLQAWRISNRLMRPTHLRIKSGNHQVKIQHSATHLRRAGVSLSSSVTSPSMISPGRGSLYNAVFLSRFWNIFRLGAYDSVITEPTSWVTRDLASKSSERRDFWSSKSSHWARRVKGW